MCSNAGGDDGSITLAAYFPPSPETLTDGASTGPLYHTELKEVRENVHNIK